MHNTILDCHSLMTQKLVSHRGHILFPIINKPQPSLFLSLYICFIWFYVSWSSLMSLQYDGETMETVTDFLSLGSKITVDSDCSHEIKRRKAAPWKKSYGKPRHCIKKQRHHFPNKDPPSKAMVFPVVMYGCESWTIKKAYHWSINVLSCGAAEDSWESLELQGDQTSWF